MNPEDFQSTPSGSIIRRVANDGEYWAFSPNPLPPKISIDRFANKLEEAARNIGMLAGLGRQIGNPRLLLAPLLRREALLSSRIEGTFSTIVDVYAYEAQQLELFRSEGESDLRVQNALEVTNYVRAMEHGLERLAQIPVSKRLITEIHEILLKGVRGEERTPGQFRRIQNAIGEKGDSLTEARFVPPPPDLMPSALDTLETYINTTQDLPYLIKLALIHYQFETIHPFLDGNGRIGRLMIPLLLQQWQILPFPMLYISLYFDRNKKKYQSLLYDVSAKGAWPEWISFFLEAANIQSLDSIDLIEQILELEEDFKSRLEENHVTVNQLNLVEHLFDQPIISIPQAAEKLNVTWRGAKLIFDRFMEEEILEHIPNSEHPRVYVAREIIDILT